MSDDQQVSVLGLVGQAIEIQSDLDRRLLDAKKSESAEEISSAMDGLCRDVLKWVTDWVKLGKRAVFGEGCVLSWVDKWWEQLGPLHAQYSSFDDFAKQETGEEYSTYRAKIAIYRVFLLNEFRVPRIAELGPSVFLDVPIGKLQKAVAKAKRNQMDDEQWEALLDPNVNDASFRQILMRFARLEEGEEGESCGELIEGREGRTVFDLATGDLVYYGEKQNDFGVVIGKLDSRAKSDEVREEIDRIVSVANIRRRE